MAKKTDDDKATYAALKQKLADDAMGGDGRALETWLKTFGTNFVNEDLSRVENVKKLSDVQLAREVVGMLSVAQRSQLFRELGYKKRTTDDEVDA